MKLNQVIRRKEDLLNHFGSSQKLEISNLQQIKNLLALNVQPKIWEDASNRNLFFFNQQLVQKTKEYKFNYGQIKYIYFISFLTNLTELNLQNNKISDITSIYKFKSLQKLELQHNCIEDISALQYFTDLIYLAEIDLSYNNISDISSISKLKNLKKLYLGSNYIKDISALQSLLNLTHINIYFNQLTSYTVALPNLVYLSLSDNDKLQDTSGLQHSPKLESLDLSKTEITDLRTIPSQLFGLKEFKLSQNYLTEILYISNFLGLQKLWLDYNQQLQNIGPLKFCTQLTELNFCKTSISDIWPLQFMKNLKTLNMDNTKVVDLHPLQYLYKLELISAFGAYILDVSPLSNLTQLNSFDFSFNKITNAEPLKHHKNFSQYKISLYKAPTTDELKFYSKILSVHSSHKQIRKIQAENKISKFQKSMTHQKESINLKIIEQIQFMNMKIEIIFIFSHNSYADQ
ncbi:leucine-rich_repeat domain-containing protein [Hexamita inflata]|uniref:Leucine-rich repeat domain-containing protein n=1 Tax=Hexamita inflata TaxID=28002 RepID=A0AA86N8R1_9EUKA|nr:leucine-rich repeat domain-containing protein [Hexamita inflata]